jgi:hypothetical protein
MIVKINLCPFDEVGLIGPTISTAILSKGTAIIGIVSKGTDFTIPLEETPSDKHHMVDSN